MHYDHPDSLYGCCTDFHMPDHGEGFKHFKTVGALQGACRTLQDDAECLYGRKGCFPYEYRGYAIFNANRLVFFVGSCSGGWGGGALLKKKGNRLRK